MAPRDFKGGKNMFRFASSKALRVGSSTNGRKGSQLEDFLHVLNNESLNPSDPRAPSCGLDLAQSNGSLVGSAARNNGALDDNGMDEDALPLKTPMDSDLHEAAIILHGEEADRVLVGEDAARVSCKQGSARVSSLQGTARVLDGEMQLGVPPYKRRLGFHLLKWRLGFLSKDR